MSYAVMPHHRDLIIDIIIKLLVGLITALLHRRLAQRPPEPPALPPAKASAAVPPLPGLSGARCMNRACPRAPARSWGPRRAQKRSGAARKTILTT